MKFECPVCKTPHAPNNAGCSILCEACTAKRWLRDIPTDYLFADLATLEPSDKSLLPLDRQQAVLNMLRADPEKGYAFFGKPGIGKTVWTYALHRHAVKEYNADWLKNGKFRKYPCVWRMTTKSMLDEHTAYATTQFADDLDRRLNQPTITAAKIAFVRNEQGEVPRLFLEELDKVKETEARRTTLFEIIDTLQAHGGQLVINSNLTPEEFAARMGADLWWRIEKMCVIVSLF